MDGSFAKSSFLVPPGTMIPLKSARKQAHTGSIQEMIVHATAKS